MAIEVFQSLIGFIVTTAVLFIIAAIIISPLILLIWYFIIKKIERQAPENIVEKIKEHDDSILKTNNERNKKRQDRDRKREHRLKSKKN